MTTPALPVRPLQRAAIPCPHGPPYEHPSRHETGLPPIGCSGGRQRGPVAGAAACVVARNSTLYKVKEGRGKVFKFLKVYIQSNTYPNERINMPE